MGTRGTFVYIEDGKAFYSTEFNGNMHYGKYGYGERVMDTLKEVNNLNNFKGLISQFCREFDYHFPKCHNVNELEVKNDVIDLKDVAADFTYIKNMDDVDYKLISSWQSLYPEYYPEPEVFDKGEIKANELKYIK